MAYYQPPSHLPNPNDPRNWPDPRTIAMEKEGLRTFAQAINEDSTFIRQDPRLTEMEQNRQRTLLQGTKYPISPSQFGEDYSVNTIQKFYPGKVRIVRKTLEHYYPQKFKTCSDCTCKTCQKNKEEISQQILKQEQEYEVWYHIPIKVNILKPLPKSPENKEEMETKIGIMIKTANSILKMAGIALKYNADTDLIFDAGGLFAVDGNLDTESNNPDIAIGANRELKDMYNSCCNPENDERELKKGRKIIIAPELGKGLTGFTSHPSQTEWLSTMLLIKNKYMPNSSGEDAEEMGHTLAHEFCHSVTLGPGHKYTDDNDPNSGKADNNGHVEPSTESELRKYHCNLMRKSPPDKCPAGPELTKTQITEIRDYIDKNTIGDKKTGNDRKVKNNYKKTKKK